MNARPKAFVGYAVGWLLTISFVVLFTLIFNFVGTLICAALAGMMMGAARLGWWQSFTVSLLFPAVVSLFFEVSKAELRAGQVGLIALLCFSLFWIIYFGLRALTPQESSAPKRVHVAGVISRKQAGADTRTSGVLPKSPAVNLALLQGEWLSGTQSNGSKAQKRLQINKDTLVVSLTDEFGRVRRMEGQLKMCSHCAFGIRTAVEWSCGAPEFEVSI